MEAHLKKELTYCSMLPYDLKTKDIEQGFDGIRTVRYETIKWSIENTLPILFGMENLTKGVLEGGLIPIVELFKEIIKEDLFGDIRTFRYSDHYGAEAKTLKDYDIIPVTANLMICGNTIIRSKHSHDYNYLGELYKVHPTKIHHFNIIEKLKEWHFNIYDLPSEMYIEKSTLNQ